MTSMLQPLDVSINKPMKAALCQKWNAWISGDDHSFTNTGKMRKPELPTICTWIVEAWQELDPEITIQSFKKCTISNALDRSEDNIVWQDNTNETPTDEPSNPEDGEDDHDIFYNDQEDDDNMPLSALGDI